MIWNSLAIPTWITTLKWLTAGGRICQLWSRAKFAAKILSQVASWSVTCETFMKRFGALSVSIVVNSLAGRHRLIVTAKTCTITRGILNAKFAWSSLQEVSVSRFTWNPRTRCEDKICGQSYKHFMLVNYDSRVVPDWKIPQITTLES